MEELYESEVTWAGYQTSVAGKCTSRYASPRRRNNMGASTSSAPMTIPAARRARSNEYHQDSEETGSFVPPHVLVSRSRSAGKVAISVCSGQGRTLKGRDLSRARDSVLRMTGYLES